MNDPKHEVQKAAVWHSLAMFIAALIIMCLAFAAFGQTTNSVLSTNTFTYPVPVVTFTNVTQRTYSTNLIITVGIAPTNIVPPAVTNAPVKLTASTMNPSGPFWVRAEVTNTLTVKRVDFWVDGSLYHPEGQAPYYLFGDDGTNPFNGTLPAGLHVIVARIYTNDTAYILSPSLTIVVGPISMTTTGAIYAISQTGSQPVVAVNYWISNSASVFPAGYVIESSTMDTNNGAPAEDWVAVSPTSTVKAGRSGLGQFAEWPITSHAFYRLKLWSQPEALTP